MFFQTSPAVSVATQIVHRHIPSATCVSEVYYLHSLKRLRASGLLISFMKEMFCLAAYFDTLRSSKILE